MIKRYIVNKRWLQENVQIYDDELEMVKYNDIKDNLVEWHSVEEDPETYTRGLLTYDGKTIYINQWGRFITHWAYLPKPPKGISCHSSNGYNEDGTLAINKVQPPKGE